MTYYVIGAPIIESDSLIDFNKVTGTPANYAVNSSTATRQDRVLTGTSAVASLHFWPSGYAEWVDQITIRLYWNNNINSGNCC